MLYLYEMFKSISGEVGAIPQGSPCVFIRFGGCHLRCWYCDTKEAHTTAKSTPLGIDSIMSQYRAMTQGSMPGPMPVVITGGEPLLQDEDELAILIRELDIAGAPVQVETNGAVDWQFLLDLRRHMFRPVCLVVDYKLDGSFAFLDSTNMAKRMPHQKYRELLPDCWVKLVVSCTADFDQALEFIQLVQGGPRVAVSCVQGRDWNLLAELSSWYIQNNLMDLGICLNVQVHKVLGLA